MGPWRSVARLAWLPGAPKMRPAARALTRCIRRSNGCPGDSATGPAADRLAEGVVLFLLAHGRGGAVAGKENECLGQCQDAFPDALQVNRVERGGVSPPDG